MEFAFSLKKVVDCRWNYGELELFLSLPLSLTSLFPWSLYG